MSREGEKSEGLKDKWCSLKRGFTASDRIKSCVVFFVIQTCRYLIVCVYVCPGSAYVQSSC